jgi:hypothetical protein
MAAAALGEVPAHLRGHTNAQLLIAIGRGFVLGTEPLRAYLRLNLGEHRPAAAPITLSDEAREALTRLLKPLRGWRNAPTVGHRIHELGEYGLPGTRDQLAAWLRTDHLAVALDPDKQRFPTAEDESRLWAMVEAAWARRGPEVSRARHALAARATRSVADISIVGDALTVFLLMLTWQCRGLTGDELIGLDRVVERKLYDIDQAAIQAITGGSDDGFLYARGFTIAMGRDFYHAVACDPQIAVPGSECERMCYFFAHLHRIRFGQFPYTGSGISRESGSNPAGWPD